MKRFKNILTVTALLAFGVGLVSCGGDKEAPVVNPTLSFELSETEIELTEGLNETISLVDDGVEREYTWETSNPEIAYIQYRGNMAMITGKGPGEATVTVSGTVNGSYFARSCDVTVNEYVHVEVPLTDPHPDGFVDYAHDGSCTLPLEYSGKDFFQVGVGEFDLWMAIDGDTAHFTPKVTTTSSETVKARFYGIDTPESTGRIQPYGKQASNFTKAKLKNAKENGTIVLAGVSSEYGKPGTDANGRYLCCVWIHETKKNAPINELVNLNLWIIEEGFSDPGSLNKMPEYQETFVAAYQQAKACKLKKFSGKADPLFPTGAVKTTIPDIMKQVYAYMDGESDINPFEDTINVTFKGTVVGYANNTLFLQAYDFIVDTYYGINCFCGMTTFSAMYRKVGTYLQCTGYAQDSENFGFQITGLEGHFPAVASQATEDDVHILLTPEENVYKETALHDYTLDKKTLNASLASRAFLGSGVCLTDTVTVNYFNKSQDGKKYTIGFEGVDFDVYLTNAYAGDPDKPHETWTEESQWKGKTFEIKRGILTYHTQVSGKIRYQLLIDTPKTNLIWVKD